MSRASTLIGAIKAMLVVVSTAVAGPFEDAVAAYRDGEYATALRLFRPLADRVLPRGSTTSALCSTRAVAWRRTTPLL
jgi:hypothetical protein